MNRPAKAPFAAKFSVAILIAALVLRVGAAEARTEVSLAKPVQHKGVPISWRQGAIRQISGGGYIAVADSRVLDAGSSSKTVYVIADYRLRVFRWNSRGSLSRRFLRGNLGRGIKVGRAGEIWDFRGPYQLRRGVFYFVGSTTGHLYNDTTHPDQPATAIVAFNPSTGNLEKGFGSGGVEINRMVSGSTPYTLQASDAVPIDGSRILECGTANFPYSHGDRAYVREIDGFGVSPITTNGDGITMFDPPAGFKHSRCTAIARDGAGGFFIAGVDSDDPVGDTSNPSAWVARIRATGSLVGGFGNAGFTRLRAALPSSTPQNLKPQYVFAAAGGGAVVAGTKYESTDAFAIRIGPNGAVDPSYGAFGFASVGGLGLNAATLDSDSNLYLGGAYEDKAVPEVAELTSSGQPADAFGNHGTLRMPELWGAFSAIFPSGKLVQAWGAAPRRHGKINYFDPLRLVRIRN